MELRSGVAFLLRTFCAIVLGVAFLASVQAAPNVTVSNGSDTLEVSVTVFSPQSFGIDVVNSGDVKLHNISMSSIPSGTFSTIPSLDAGQAGAINLSVLTSSIFSQTFVTTVSFFEEIPFIEPTKIVDVIVNSSGYFPNNITVHPGDSVNFSNNAFFNMSFSDLGSTFTLEVPPNESRVQVFNELGSFVIVEDVTNLVAELHVLNQSAVTLVHNTANDKNFFVKINSVPPQTSLELNVFRTSFELEYNQKANHVLSVKNTGVNAARDVVLSGDFFSFSTQNFTNINPGEELFAFFDVGPLNISHTSETNKSYELLISMSATNAPAQSKNVSVFIKGHNFESGPAGNGSVGPQVVYVLDPVIIKQICDNQPDICPYRNVTQVVYQEPNVTFDVPAEDAKNLFSKILPNIEKRLTTAENSQRTDVLEPIQAIRDEVKGLKDDTNRSVSDLRNDVDNWTGTASQAQASSEQRASDAERSAKATKEDTTGFFLAVTMLGGLGLSIIFAVVATVVYFKNRRMGTKI